MTKRRPIIDLYRICEWIDGYLAEHRYAPTVRELGNHLGVTSSQTPWHVLQLLAMIGWVDFVGKEPRTIHTTDTFRAVDPRALEETVDAG